MTQDLSTAVRAAAASSRGGLPRGPGVPGRLGYLVRNRALVSALWLLDHLPWPVRQAPRPAVPPRKLLVAMIGHLGDCVVASAVLERIARALPEAEIGMLVAPSAAAFFRDDFRVARLHLLDHWRLSREGGTRGDRLRRHIATRRAAIREMRAIGYDAAIDLYFYFPSVAPILRAARIPVRIGYASGGFRRHLTHAVPWIAADRHVTEYQAALLPLLGIAPERLAAVPLRPALPALVARSPVVLPLRCAVLHMGAATRSKEWPEERWREVAGALAARGLALVLTGRGAREAGRNARFAAAIPGTIDLTDRLDLAQFRAVLAAAKLVICLDTLAAHLAALDAVPTIVLRPGINNPAHWRPLNDRARVLHTTPPCLPCYEWRGCASMACLREVGTAQVLAAATRLLDASVIA